MDTIHVSRPRDTLAERPAMIRHRLGAVWLVILFAGCQAVPVPPLSDPFTQAGPPPPAVGDSWVYRISNGYNQEVRGQVRYQVEKLDAGATVVSATPDNPLLGQPYTVVYTKEGNWLRHPVASHGHSVEYTFATAYPAYLFPLQPNKAWSLRVGASDPTPGRRISVRVDGKVLGAERIRVPAGEFDIIRIRRVTYGGDWDGFRAETHTHETDWYAPALGRPVRTERNSLWRDASQCGREGCPWFYGDWDVYELVAFNRSPRR